MPSVTLGAGLGQTWTAPSNIAGPPRVQAWGESGAATPGVSSNHSGAGAGTGGYSEENPLGGVTAGTVLTINVGSGGTATATTVTGGTVTVTANPGGSASGSIAGTAAAASSNTIARAGSAGGAGFVGSTKTGGGGGGSPGATGSGTAGTAGSSGGAGGSAGAGGGAAGGAGGAPLSPGAAGGSPGAGPGGGGNNGNQAAGAVAAGQVIITWSVIVYSPTGYAAAAGVMATAKKAVSGFRGYMSFTGAPLPVRPVNQWSGTFSQPATFGNPPPALQSVVVPLTPAASVGGGSGVPSAGNWLFCITGMNEQATAPGFTTGDNDDIHSFWRVGGVSPKTGALTRTSVWYTPSIARAVQDVYVAPNGAFDALTVLVVEVAGLGPWDSVTGVFTNYAAAASSLALSLAAPSAQAFVLAAAAGDSTASAQSVTGTGWTALSTVTATNGSDHTCDSVLTAAYTVTTGSAAPTIAASPAVDLSGVIIGVLTSAPSPVPSGGNAAWPYIHAEMAFGSGFQTPADEMTWTEVTKRWWSWHETTGIQYQLGALQATDCDMELDNWDGAFSPGNPGSIFYSNALNINMSFNMAYPHAGLSGWSPMGNATIAPSAAQAYASAPDAVATYSMMVTPDGVTASPGAQCEMDPVTAGNVYSASAWFYSQAGWSGGAQVVINWYNASQAFISSSVPSALVIPAATWTQAVNLGVTAPVGAAYATATPRFAGTPAAVPFWVAEAGPVAGSLPIATGLVATGTPVRLRMALGTIGGVQVNRWYVIQRNASGWPEKRNKALRNFVPAKLTDIWSVASASCPTPYRGEVEQDSPVSWYPMDDQPGVNGVLPTFLRNAAKGNSAPLTINLSPNGVRVQNQQLVDGGGDVVLSSSNPGTIATYAVAQDGGWMPGDPQSSPQSAATGNPVTSQPGSASWQQTGESGTSGAYGFYLLAHDTSFPPLASGASLEIWFKMPFFGTASLANPNLGGPQSPPCNTPYAPVTIAELMTASAPVGLLQLDVSGNLSFITYNGGSSTSHSIYSTSDLRSETYHQVVMTTDGSNWTVYVDGGLTATVSGSGAGMTSAWSYLLMNGDFGSNGGTNPSGYSHSGNIWLSHAEVYAGRLPAFRVRAHYCAAITALGYLPAPTSVAANFVHSGNSAEDGSNAVGTVSGSAGYPPNTQTVMSAVVVAQAGAYTSGPSAWAAVADWANSVAMAAWTSWQGLAPLFAVYTNSQVGGETQAATAAGAGDGFVSGWGSGASPKGFCHVGSGSGAAPPTAPTPLGDTVGQRLERIFSLGSITAPNRAIDPAPLLVQGATDVGGQQCGQAAELIVSSDDGLFAIGNGGEIFYRQRPHLASDAPVWQLGPDVQAGQLPYSVDQEFSTDSTRVVNDVEITPFSPDGASLPIVTPSNATGVNASQKQVGARSLQVTSYLQDQTKPQIQADWLFSNFGTNRRRVAALTVDAAPHPAAWPFVCGVNIGDLVQVSDMPVSGAPITQGIYRVTELTRSVSFGANGASVTGAVEILADFEPDSYWS